MTPAIDIGTFYFAVSLVAGFFGIAFLAFRFIDTTTRGILQWAAGYILVAVGLLLAIYHAPLPFWLYGPLSSFLLILGAVFLDVGTRTGNEAGGRWLDIAFPVAVLIMLAVFSYVVPSLEARLHVLLVGLAAVTIRTSVRLGAQARAAKGGLRTALITFVCFYSVLAVVLITIAVLAARSDPIQDVVDQHPIHAILLPALMLFLIGAAMSKLWVHYMHAYMEAKRAATFDPLTGVRNRRYFMPELERLFQRSKREGTRLACLMLDADTFKDVNDTYGHRKGDEVLQQLADRITDAVREYDLVGRYGGEEFIVVVPEREPQDVINMANRLHQSIRVTPLAGVELTVSVGVAFRSGHDVSTDDLIQRADRALYEAKRKGRDKIAVEHNDE